MKTTLEYLDEAKKVGGFENDSQFAKAMAWSSGAMTRYRDGSRVMNRRACLQVAAFLKLDLKETLNLILLAEQEESGQLPLGLKDYFRQVAVWIGFIVLLVGSATASKDSMAAPTSTTDSGNSRNYVAENNVRVNQSDILYIIQQKAMQVIRHLARCFGYPCPA